MKSARAIAEEVMRKGSRGPRRNRPVSPGAHGHPFHPVPMAARLVDGQRTWQWESAGFRERLRQGARVGVMPDVDAVDELDSLYLKQLFVQQFA